MQIFSSDTQEYSEIIMIQNNSKSINKNEINDLKRKEINIQFPKIDISFKQTKSQKEILEEKSDRAEKYLRMLGNELHQLRDLYSDIDMMNISSTSSVSDFSPKPTKPKVSKKKVNRGEKRIVSDIRQLTLNLMLL